MAGLNLTPIPASKRGSRTPLADIDTSVGETVEEAFTYCQASPDRLQSDPFTSKDAAEEWLTEARAYAYQRPAGRLVVAGNSSQARLEDGKPDGAKYVVRFRVVPFVAAESAE